jgi:hypothetical protein
MESFRLLIAKPESICFGLLCQSHKLGRFSTHQLIIKPTKNRPNIILHNHVEEELLLSIFIEVGLSGRPFPILFSGRTLTSQATLSSLNKALIAPYLRSFLSLESYYPLCYILTLHRRTQSDTRGNCRLHLLYGQ